MGLGSEIARPPKGLLSSCEVDRWAALGRAYPTMTRSTTLLRIPPMPAFMTRRRGTTSVEVAFILPVFLTFVFAIFEYGRSVMVANLLQCACRNAARMGATEGITTQQTIDRVEQYLDGAIDTSSLTVVVKNASVWDSAGPYPDTASEFSALPSLELSSSSQRQLFLVRATVNYSNVSLTSLPFFQGLTLTGQSFMRHE